MIHIVLVFLLLSAILVMQEEKIFKMIIFLGIFSLISSVCFLLLAAPDVAIAEAVVSTYSTIIFIIAFEKYYARSDLSIINIKKVHMKKNIFPIVFTLFLFVVFIMCIPKDAAISYSKELYVSMFKNDIGGKNAVTAIYLGYRMYDTLFEALMLLISIVAIVHLSWHKELVVYKGKENNINRSDNVLTTIYIISPVLIIFGIYLIVNGHISPGGGFQGGVIIATFFICRYLIYTIYDIRIDRVIALEKMIYIIIILLAVFFVFSGVYHYLPIPKSIYLIAMNVLVGMKVACGFLVIFYRFIVVERG